MAQREETEGVAGKRRTLALEVRRSTFGFVMLEGVSLLLDWGARRRSPGQAVATSFRKITALLDTYGPADIVVGCRGGHRTLRGHGEIALLVRMIRAEAKRRSINVRIVKKSEVRSFFATHACRNKHARATLLTGWFEELSRYLPPSREIWRPEPYSMRMFDALASAMTLFGRS